MTVVSDWMKQHPLIGVVGFPALPGAIDYRGTSREEFIQRAIVDAQAYAQAGFDALMIQNVGDLPVAAQVGPETVAWLSALGSAIRSAVALPLGVCVLKNDGCAALAIAQAIGAVFVRIKVWVGAMVGAEGIVQGCAPTKNISRLLEVADGVIVATAAKVGGQLLNPVDRQAAEDLNSAANGRRIHQGMMAK